MNRFLTISTHTTLLLGVFLITGCSSSDDGGTTTDDGGTTTTSSVPANAITLDATNAESTIATSVTTVDSLSFVLAAETAPTMGLLDALEIIQPRIDSIKTALKNTGADPVYGVAVSESGNCDVSGTFSFTGDEGGISPNFTDSGTVIVVNCDDGLGFIINGTFSWIQSWNIDTGVYSNTLTGGFSIISTDPNNAFSFSFTGVDYAENGNEIDETYTITKATYAVSLVASGIDDFGFLAQLTAPIVESNGIACPESGTIFITGANGTTAEGIYNGDGTMTINVNGALVDAAAQCYY